MVEEWRPIPGHPDYEVSSLGRIKSFKGRRGIPEKIMSPKKCKTGYLSIQLVTEGKRYHQRIHRLVLLAFYGSSDLTVNHINGIKHDNSLENLEYLTAYENIQHARRIGIYSSGERNGRAILTEEQVKEIRERYITVEELAETYGVHKNTIVAVLDKRNWSLL